MYLALSEHTAPLGGIHDVFIKDAVGEYRSSCKGRIMPSTFFDAQTQNCIFSGEFLQRYKRWMGVSASGWQVRAYGIRTPSWGVEWDWRALAAKPEVLPSWHTDKRRNTGLKSMVQVEQVLSAAIWSWVRADAGQLYTELLVLLAAAQALPAKPAPRAREQRRGRFEHQGTNQIAVWFMAVLRDV